MGLNVVFMGTPAFAVPALRGLLHSDHKVVAVYSQPPRPANRGQKLTPSPVHLLAEEHGVAVHTPVNFKAPESIDELRAIGADIAVVAAYGLLLPKTVLESFPKGCVNIHPSALPRWRGAAPIQRTVLAGDEITDLCIMQMDEGLDTGAVLLRDPWDVPEGITSAELHDMLSEESAPLLIEALNAIEAGTVIAVPQPEEGVTYAKKISKEEAQIDWSHTAEAISRQVRGLNPFPIAATTLNGEPIKILEAEVLSGSGQAGITADDNFTIGTGDGLLRPTLVQRPGKKPMPTEEMLRGYPIPAGTKLG